MISAGSVDGEPLLSGMITVVQMCGNDLGWHPHLPALVTRTGWDPHVRWVGVPFVEGGGTAAVVHHRV